MGWLWFVGSIKLQVPFAKEPYERDNILQKRPIIDPTDRSHPICVVDQSLCYGVALVSRIDKMTDVFCKRALYKRQYSAKETYNLCCVCRATQVLNIRQRNSRID